MVMGPVKRLPFSWALAHWIIKCSIWFFIFAPAYLLLRLAAVYSFNPGNLPGIVSVASPILFPPKNPLVHPKEDAPSNQVRYNRLCQWWRVQQHQHWPQD
jgi:hypothetical protein